MPGVTLQRVTKIHRGPRGTEVRALCEATLELGDGECAVVVGPSGSGKTTLLRLMAGLDEPTSGDLTIGGKPMRGVPSRERGVAMVFQDHPLFPHLNVTGNLALGMRLRHVPSEEMSVRLAEVKDWLGLGPLADRMPGTLSGGERQRVALGMALVQRPKVLLLDEPFAHLDARWRLHLRREFRALQRRLGLTWVHVTHDQSEAMAMADRLVVLDAGKVLQAGKPGEVYGRPEHRFIAEFLGSPGMNLFRGTLVLSEGPTWEFRVAGECTLFGGGAVPAPARPAGGGKPGALSAGHEDFGKGSGWKTGASERWLGVRPEHVRLRELGAAGGRDVDFGFDFPGIGVEAEGIVTAVEPLGHETWVHVRLGTGAWLVARVSGASHWVSGSQVRAGFPVDAIHWYDPLNGHRIE
ncbi:MAG: ABC transporter ATP-binding protein [Limisphaerales bacterium]